MVQATENLPAITKDSAIVKEMDMNVPVGVHHPDPAPQSGPVYNGVPEGSEAGKDAND